MKIVVILAIVIVSTLLVLAIYYTWRLYRFKKMVLARQVQVDIDKTEQKKRILYSVEIICRAIVEGQVTHTEACIRISTLMRALEITDQNRAYYSVFFDLTVATAHMPILGDWQKLPADQKKVFNLEREVIEAKYKDFVVAAAQRFLDCGLV